MPASNHRTIERMSLEQLALTEVAKTLTLPLEIPILLERVLEKIHFVLEPAEVGTVMLWDQSSGLFRSGASFGYNQEILKRIGLRAGESITGKVYDEGKTSLLATREEVAEAMADMRPANQQVLAQALGGTVTPICAVAAPITAGDSRYGVVVLETIHGPQVFHESDLPFIHTLADLIALSIDRARLEARADAIRAAREAEHMRSEVMASLSHELRLPLTAIKGYSSALLLDDVAWSEDKRREFLLLVVDECDNMQSMIKEMLDSALIDINQINLEPQPMRLPQLAREVAAEVQRRTPQHQLLVDFPADFPIVSADPRWIRQVIRNILDNAIKYAPDGGLVMIRAEVRANDVTVIIADQGIGISPEDLIPLFEKFFRVRSATSIHIPGTGLGLPIARAIVEAHGGRIWVESKLGQGTTVYFSLPKAKFDPGE